MCFFFPHLQSNNCEREAPTQKRNSSGAKRQTNKMSSVKEKLKKKFFQIRLSPLCFLFSGVFCNTSIHPPADITKESKKICSKQVCLIFFGAHRLFPLSVVGHS
jgi:hypothetical protein